MAVIIFRNDEGDCIGRGFAEVVGFMKAVCLGTVVEQSSL